LSRIKSHVKRWRHAASISVMDPIGTLPRRIVMADLDVSNPLQMRDATQPFDGTVSPNRLSRLAVLHAFVGLVAIDTVLHIQGYARLRQSLKSRRCVVEVPTTDMVERAKRIVAAVDRACVYYPRRAMCLQRSAVMTWLMRRSRLPVDMVIGCRHTPFYAHAWVEMDGAVLNDRQAVKENYPEMERI